MVFRKLGRAVKAGMQQTEPPVGQGADVADSELNFYVVGKVDDVGPGELKYVEVGPNYDPICLINFEGDFYALGDLCTHEEASLSDGEIQGDEIECPLHGGAFEIRTGLPANFPVVVPATMYRTRVVGDEVQIGLPKR
ncbi:MAG: non-heme iron oxygenase ferredoxin subunit [Thermomicrobiales bacterium]|nr:non-heme iron oxygenase ferredoxin subunit [Thermomicrobiales bacterium]